MLNIIWVCYLEFDAFCCVNTGLYVNAGVVRIYTEHNSRCGVTSEDIKAQKRVTYRGKKIHVMQDGLKTANFILEKDVNTSTLENEILIRLLLRNWI